jgi:hypothetical protein
MTPLSSDLSQDLTYPCQMARRADPERLYEAHRAGLFQRLISGGRLSGDRAQRWLVDWEAEAARRGLDRRTGNWWSPAWEWIAEQRGPTR